MFYRIRKWYKNVLHRLIGDWYYFLYDESIHEQHVLNRHYNQSKVLLPCPKTVIYMANGFCNHAGLCDRLKGITTLYGWCKNNHLEFRAFHIHPFNLTDYLIPNQYDWRLDTKDICYNKKYTSVNHLMLNSLVKKQIESGEISKLERAWFQRRIKTPKLQLHFYTNMQPESDLLFGTYFLELFKPSPRLARVLNYHLQSIGNSFISVSFRFMQLLGDFKDCDGDTLSNEDQEDLINKSIEVIKSIKDLNMSIPKVLVTSDSSTFLERVKDIPYVYVVEGKVGHINFEHSDDVTMKAFLDFLMIANAKKVYLAKSKKMYRSDFSRYASMINHQPFELYIF